MKKEVLKIKIIDKEVGLPEYMNSGDVGFDLRAAENKKMLPGAEEVIKTGIIMEIPKGYVGLLRDRAGIVTKMNVHTVAGTFDSDYRGKFLLFL